MKYGHVSDSSQSKSTYKHKGISNVKNLSEALYEKILEEGRIDNSTNVADDAKRIENRVEMDVQDEAELSGDKTGSSVDETFQDEEAGPSDGSQALQDDKAVQQQQEEELGPSDDQPSQDEEAFQHEESQELFGGEQEGSQDESLHHQAGPPPSAIVAAKNKTPQEKPGISIEKQFKIKFLRIFAAQVEKKISNSLDTKLYYFNNVFALPFGHPDIKLYEQLKENNQDTSDFDVSNLPHFIPKYFLEQLVERVEQQKYAQPQDGDEKFNDFFHPYWFTIMIDSEGSDCLYIGYHLFVFVHICPYLSLADNSVLCVFAFWSWSLICLLCRL